MVPTQLLYWGNNAEMGCKIPWDNFWKIQTGPQRIQKNGTIPKICLNLGRPRREISDECKDLVKLEHGKYGLNALYLEKVIYAKHKIRIPHNTIHKIMLKKGFSRRRGNPG